MSNLSQRRSFWRSLPLIVDWVAWRAEVNKPRYRLAPMAQQSAELAPYPIDFFPMLMVPHGTLDEKGVPYNRTKGEYTACYQPTTIATYALAHWNGYLETGGEQHRQAFLTQAHWLVEHETRVDSEASVWPIPYRSTSYYAPGPWLSAMTQGMVASVLVRAYQLTGDAPFLDVARRGVRPFERDILDGGVSAFVGEDGGVFFEEVAVYPAAHILNGFLFALFGLYDYVALTSDSAINDLIQRSLATLHGWIDGYDAGHWSRYDLLNKHQAPLFYHDVHVLQLQALARLSGCAHCAALAARWEQYEQRAWCRFRHFVDGRVWRYRRWVQRVFFSRPASGVVGSSPVCVPMSAFPLAGGGRDALAEAAEALAGEWQMEYFTRQKGPGVEGLPIRTFGSGAATPWQFPGVWLYVFSGWRSLLALLARRPAYHRVILAQDGVFTGAFAALAAKLAGIPVVCMEHGTVTLLTSDTYRAGRRRALQSKPWLVRPFFRLLLLGYWPSIRLLARIATRCTDSFLAADEQVAEMYRRQFGVDSGSITVLPPRLDVQRYPLLDAEQRARLREQQGIAADALVITLIQRLSLAEEGAAALQGIGQALSTLSPDARARARVVIAGDGSRRSEVEAEVQRAGLGAICRFWGEATPEEGVTLLGMTDIFLGVDPSTDASQGNGLAVPEAMAAGCAVIALARPGAWMSLLADGWGMALPAGDAEALGAALSQLIADPALCRRMGQRARAYIAADYYTDALRRRLRRATFWWMPPAGTLQARTLESVTAGDRLQ